jgi:hypothetical protein
MLLCCVMLDALEAFSTTVQVLRLCTAFPYYVQHERPLCDDILMMQLCCSLTLLNGELMSCAMSHSVMSYCVMMCAVVLLQTVVDAGAVSFLAPLIDNEGAKLKQEVITLS